MKNVKYLSLLMVIFVMTSCFSVDLDKNPEKALGHYWTIETTGYFASTPLGDSTYNRDNPYDLKVTMRIDMDSKTIQVKEFLNGANVESFEKSFTYNPEEQMFEDWSQNDVVDVLLRVVDVDKNQLAVLPGSIKFDVLRFYHTEENYWNIRENPVIFTR